MECDNIGDEQRIKAHKMLRNRSNARKKNPFICLLWLSLHSLIVPFAQCDRTTHALINIYFTKLESMHFLIQSRSKPNSCNTYQCCSVTAMKAYTFWHPHNSSRVQFREMCSMEIENLALRCLYTSAKSRISLDLTFYIFSQTSFQYLPFDCYSQFFFFHFTFRSLSLFTEK